MTIQENTPIAMMTVGQLDDYLFSRWKSFGFFPTAEKQQKEKDLMIIDEASDFTGYSRNTIYKKVNERAIPYHKAQGGQKLIFSRKELSEWMTSQKVETLTDEVEKKEIQIMKGHRK